MKIFIGLALLSVAFATEPFDLPAASQPAYEVNEPSQADDSQVLIADFVMFQTPDISPAFIEPALANMLNEFGEIRQEILDAQVADVPGSAVLFVDHADEVAPLNEAVKVSPVQVADVLPEAQEAAVDSELVDSVLFVDAPLEEDSKSADVVDIVQEDAKTSEAVDPVLFVDAPLEDAKSADIEDTVQEDAKAGEVVDPVLFVDAPLEEDAKTADVVDSVLFVDAPLEDNASFADAPAPSDLDQFIAKLLANRREIISRDNPMLR